MAIITLGSKKNLVQILYKCNIAYAHTSMARSKKQEQEARSKKQETWNRKQEARSKKQEAGSKKQEIGSRKQEAGSKKTPAFAPACAPAPNFALACALAPNSALARALAPNSAFIFYRSYRSFLYFERELAVATMGLTGSAGFLSDN